MQHVPARLVRLSLCLLLALGSLGVWSLGTFPVSADLGSAWLPGPNASGDDTYAGFIDLPAPGSSVMPNALIVVQGWVVDRTAAGWSGVDAVEVYLGLRDQGGTLLASAQVGLPRDDVAAALGNPYWNRAGFSAAFADSGLTVGSNILSVYAHTPDKGWWYRQLEVRLPAPPPRAYADDPLLIVREVDPSLDVEHTTPNLTLRGYALDRNLPVGLVLGVGGSGVSQVQVYLDGPPNGGGTLLGSPTLGIKNREAMGFGERFLLSGWEVTVHPGEFSIDRHEFFIYALSAYWPNETLVILPFSVS